jgi:hypothetical protein
VQLSTSVQLTEVAKENYFARLHQAVKTPEKDMVTYIYTVLNSSTTTIYMHFFMW